MKGPGIKQAILGSILAVTVVLGAVFAEARMIPRVDNFVILVDQSGSMFMEHKERKEVKAKLVKKMLLSMNERIPELGYTAAIQGFYPKETLIGPETFSQAFFKREIEKLPEKGKIFGNRTPLGVEIKSLNKIMNRFSGKTAIIIVSDGESNEGMDPFKAARFIHSEHTNVCFDVISFADSKEGEMTLKKINGLGNCTYAEGEDLISDVVAVETFVSNALYMEAAAAKPAVREIAPEIITVEGAYFAHDSAEIKPAAWTPIFEVVYKKYAKMPGARVIVEGHTDSTGSASYNKRLSKRRAEAVRDYFVSKGMAADKVEAVGFGETMPRVSNTTPEGRSVNRRVDIRIVE